MVEPELDAGAMLARLEEMIGAAATEVSYQSDFGLRSDELEAQHDLATLQWLRALAKQALASDPALDLDAIDARANAATPGPWIAWLNPDPDKYSDPAIWRWQVDQDERVIAGGYRIIKGAWKDADAEFIAAARADVPALVAEVRRLRARLDT